MKFLARRAVAEFGIQWLLTTQLVLDLATVAASRVADMKVGVIFMNFVWGTVFPLVQFAFHMSWIAVLAVAGRGLFWIDHRS